MNKFLSLVNSAILIAGLSSTASAETGAVTLDRYSPIRLNPMGLDISSFRCEQASLGLFVTYYKITFVDKFENMHLSDGKEIAMAGECERQIYNIESQIRSARQSGVYLQVQNGAWSLTSHRIH